MKRYPLSLYVTGVIIVLAILNCFAWLAGQGLHARNISSFSGGFLMGMLARYIAVHIYKYR